MSTLERVVLRIRNRGWRDAGRAFLRRVSVTVDRALDRRFDPLHGTDTAGVVENRDMHDAPEPGRAHAVRYEPTRARPFRRLLHRARIPVAGTFVDIGCGKGRVLMLAARAGFESVVGVDHSPALCGIARENLSKLQWTRSVEYEVHAMDAREYRFGADDTVLYLFNPFDDTILRPVLENWRRSLTESPRAAVLIYQNPVWRSVVDEVSGMVHAGDFSFSGCDFAVYRSKD